MGIRTALINGTYLDLLEIELTFLLEFFFILSCTFQKVEWKINGIPLQTRPLNLTEDGYLRAYTQFMRDIGLDSPINTVNISLEMFKTRFMIISTDRIGCGCGSCHRHKEAEVSFYKYSCTFQSLNCIFR